MSYIFARTAPNKGPVDVPSTTNHIYRVVIFKSLTILCTPTPPPIPPRGHAHLSAEDNIANIRTKMRSATEDLGPSGYDPVYGRGLICSTDNCPPPK